MPSVTYDGRSFMIDGRRIWLISGSIHYARIPRELWEQRIWSARMAGLNCIETPVFWNRHEPRSGQFDFTGDNDIRHFIELIGRAGMYCILRPGPFVGAQWDMGGLPPWLLSVKGIQLRAANQPFLESCSRYITALAEQVRDLQITSPGPPPPLGGGPIILVQNEASWFGGDDKEAQAYLGELARYLRESGFNIPTLNSNNLWQGVEGEIDCWAGGGDMLATLRQLATVRPDQPRLVIDFHVGSPGVWGVPGSGAPDQPGVLQQRLAQILAAGGQFNLSPFHGGTNFGFWGGRLADHTHTYVTASRDHGAPLSETGIPNPGYASVRRLCTFASRFGRIFANLDPTYRPVILAPGTSADDATRAPMSLVYTSGPQGSIAFIFASPLDEKDDTDRTYPLVLPDGTSVPVHIGREGLAWCIFDAFLAGRARLDYCGMSAFGMLGKVLVVFGPAGTEGALSINGSPLHVVTPKGRSAPAVIEHEGITVVVCSEEQIDTAFITDDAVYIGAAGITREGEPIAMPGSRQCLRISPDGASKNVTGQQSSDAAAMPAAIIRANGERKGSEKIPLADWTMAPTTDYCDGSSARFASIDGPADLATLGSPYGYGWYRLRLKSPPSGKVRLSIPHGGDRLHAFLGGDSVGVLGFGPGAASDITFSSRKSQGTLVILAENLGRFAGGLELGEPKGVYGDIWQIDNIKSGKPSFKTAEPIDVLSVHSPIFEIQPGELTHPERITWTFQHRRKSSIIVNVGAFPGRAILIANDRTVAYIERGGGVRHILNSDFLRTGTNTVELALIPERGGDQEELEQLLAAAAAPGGITFCEAANNLSDGAEWAFAKWEMPRATAYQKFKPGTARGCPTWWRTHFRPAATGQALLFEAAGLTKGQLYVNERHICRYFVASADGKHVPPQQFYYIPSPWLRPDEENELLVFDEHGGNPAKCRLLYENGRE